MDAFTKIVAHQEDRHLCQLFEILAHGLLDRIRTP